MGFTKSEVDPISHILLDFILVLYVDDLFLMGSKELISNCNKDLASDFKMKDIGLMHYFMGLEVWQH
jgi:hypothetical protein